MIAPTETIHPYEILAGFRKFYGTMVTGMNNCVAVVAMIRTDLDVGH